MTHRIRMKDGLTVDTGQPSREEIARLAQDGFGAVVNLRMPGEPNQPLSPVEEGAVVRAAGLAYLHIPVASTDPRPEQVDQVRAQLAELPGPVLIHCASGKRSGAFAILHLAKDLGLSGKEALAKAETLGFEWRSPELEDFINRYLDCE